MRISASRALHGLALSLALSATAFSVPVLANEDAPVVVFSNSMTGNNWRQAAIESFESAAEELKQAGEIGDYQVVNADGTPTQQNSQLAEIILRQPDAIIINAASNTALNGTVARACEAGILVISFDNLVTEPCAYKLDYNYDHYSEFVRFAAEKVNGEGNALIVRGMPGVTVDEDINAQHQAALEEFPNLKVVGEVYGNWTSSVAQTAVANILPTLPPIDVVINQGGSDALGIARAFEQFDPAYRDNPPLLMSGGDAESMHWWMEQKERSGYETRAAGTAPSASAVGLYMALEILGGAEVPNRTVMPYVWITNAELDQYSDMQPGEQVAPVYTREWVRENVIGAPAE